MLVLAILREHELALYMRLQVLWGCKTSGNLCSLQALRGVLWACYCNDACAKKDRPNHACYQTGQRGNRQKTNKKKSSDEKGI